MTQPRQSGGTDAQRRMLGQESSPPGSEWFHSLPGGELFFRICIPALFMNLPSYSAAFYYALPGE